MLVKILKDVYSVNGWRKEGEIVELEGRELRHYLAVNIAEEHKGEAKKEVKKEEKAKKETKQAKAPSKRTTKRSK